ncbi:MAG: hypothetical protein JSR26_01260 [Proteobacteria bacterium]|nr:hypothetical protein [Pseudomonadota bacterium]
MTAVVATPARLGGTITLHALRDNVLREAGWILMGGSAQFRHGALSALRWNLNRLPEFDVDETLLRVADLLDARATAIAKHNDHAPAAVLGLQRTLEDFQRALPAHR